MGIRYNILFYNHERAAITSILYCNCVEFKIVLFNNAIFIKIEITKEKISLSSFDKFY